MQTQHNYAEKILRLIRESQGQAGSALFHDAIGEKKKLQIYTHGHEQTRKLKPWYAWVWSWGAHRPTASGR